MQIKILGWRSKGLRCPDMDVDLREGAKEPNVCLVQMPNGTGKTTTKELLTACLNGDAESWPPNQIANYARSDGSADEGYFELLVSIGGSLITFELTLNFLENRCSYRTSSAEEDGIRDGWRPPASLKPYLNRQFIDMVVFDGELASRLLDAKYTQAEKAIDALYQLDFLEEVAPAKAEFLWRNAKKEGAQDQSQINNINRRIEKTESKLSSEKARNQKASETIEYAKKEIDRLQHDREQELIRNQELRQQYELAEDQLRTTERFLNGSIDRFMGALTDPISSFPQVARDLEEFKEGLDKARLPESSSKQFFEEIVEQDVCICGTPFTSEMREHVRTQMDQYLSSESTSILNALKESVYRPRNPEGESFDELLRGLKDNYSNFINVGTQTEQAKASFAGPGAQEVNDIEQEIGKHKRNIDLAQPIIDQTEPEVRRLTEEQENLWEELAEAQNAVNLKKRVSVLKDICADSVRAVRERVKEKLMGEANEMLRSILVDNPVQLRNIEGALQLENQEGASVGQTVAVGYVFLARLFSHAAFSFPFIVDSPVGALDTSVRAQIGRIIPGLQRQFVAFTISSERAGFVTGLEGSSNESVRFLTIKRSDEDPNHAVIMDGRDEFFSFHADRE